jgi:uncharacterized protein YcfL
MKNLIFILLLTLSLASCKSTSEINNVDYAINDNILYHKGVEIGYLESVKLQEKKGEIRREYVFILKNETEPVGRAREIIIYLKSRIPKSDIELKTLYKK